MQIQYVEINAYSNQPCYKHVHLVTIIPECSLYNSSWTVSDYHWLQYHILNISSSSSALCRIIQYPTCSMLLIQMSVSSNNFNHYMSGTYFIPSTDAVGSTYDQNISHSKLKSNNHVMQITNLTSHISHTVNNVCRLFSPNTSEAPKQICFPLFNIIK